MFNKNWYNTNYHNLDITNRETILKYIQENNINIIINSAAYTGVDKAEEDKKTATFRKKVDVLPAKSYAKIELLLDDILSINNVFNLTFFQNNSLFEKSFEFRKNSINEMALQKIPLMNIKGVLRS